MPFGDERFAQMASHYPHIRTDRYHLDILAAHLVQHPDRFDIVVASSLFGVQAAYQSVSRQPASKTNNQKP